MTDLSAEEKKQFRLLAQLQIKQCELFSRIMEYVDNRVGWIGASDLRSEVSAITDLPLRQQKADLLREVRNTNKADAPAIKNEMEDLITQRFSIEYPDRAFTVEKPFYCLDLEKEIALLLLRNPKFEHMVRSYLKDKLVAQQRPETRMGKSKQAQADKLTGDIQDVLISSIPSHPHRMETDERWKSAWYLINSPDFRDDTVDRWKQRAKLLSDHNYSQPDYKVPLRRQTYPAERKISGEQKSRRPRHRQFASYRPDEPSR